MPKTSTTVAMDRAPRWFAKGTAREQSAEIIAASQADVSQPEPRMNQIVRRAHEIYETRGGSQGKALEDWLQAEREIDEAMG